MLKYIPANRMMMSAPHKIQLSIDARMIENRDNGYDFFKLGNDKEYKIYYSVTMGRWVCDCRDFNFRQLDNPVGKCKHIRELERDFIIEMNMVKAIVPECRSCVLKEMLNSSYDNNRLEAQK